VAIAGERLLVGAMSGVNSQGAAYIFEPGLSGLWQQRQKLAFPVYGFGRAVALGDDTAVVGAPSDSTNGRSSGSVFVYRRNAVTGRWALGQRLFWPETGEIGRANFDGTGVEVIVSDAFGAKGITLDPANGKIYWTSPALGKIQRASVDGTAIEDVVTAAFYVPEGVTLDHAAAKLYWTASLLGRREAEGKILRANLDGSAVQELSSPALFPPEGIALDPAGGKMYYAVPDSRIERANLNGTGAELIVPQSGARWIAVHAAAGKMYFTEGFRVRRGNLDGSALEDLVSEPSPPEGIALDLARGFVYWAVPELGSIRRAHLDGSGAVDVIMGLNHPFGISVDPISGAIYWTTRASRNFEEFGTSLALDGGTLMVGVSGFPRGSVHAFQFDVAAGAWQARQHLTAPGAGTDFNFDGFGLSIDLRGDRLVVGAPLEDDQGFLSGGAYLFRRDPRSGVWGAAERMRASNGAATDLFGQSVALGADSVLIGAPERDLSSSVADAGLTYVFDLQTTTAAERPVAPVGAQPAAAIVSPQATLTFNTNLKVRWPSDADVHRPVLTQCDAVVFSTSFNRLDSLGASFGSLAGQVFATTLSTGAWFDGSETLSIFRGIELDDRDLDTIEFSHTVPCSAGVGWTAFTARQGVTGFTSRRNVSTKFSFIQFFMPPF
jgi:DNA-binding beta-propeller fold protein YncE